MQENSLTLLRGHLRLINKQNGYAVAHRVDAATTRALEGAFIGSKGQRLAALRYGTHQNVEQFLEDHESYCTCQRGTTLPDTARGC